MHIDPGDTRSFPGSGSTMYDLSGLGNHATVYGDPIHNAFKGYFTIPNTDAQPTINQYIEIANNSLVQNFSNGITACFWFRPLSSQSSNEAVCPGFRVRILSSSSKAAQNLGASPDQMYISAAVVYKTLFTFQGRTQSVTSNFYISALFNCPTPKWLHITIVQMPTVFIIYIDGKLVTSSSASYYKLQTQGWFPANTPFNGIPVVQNIRFIGRYPNGTLGSYYYDGSHGSYRLYNVPLSSTMIQDIYNDEKTRYLGSNEVSLAPLITDGLVFSTKGNLRSDTVGNTTGQQVGTVYSYGSSGGYTLFGDPPEDRPKDFYDAIKYTNTAVLQNVNSITMSVWFRSEFYPLPTWVKNRVTSTVDYRLGFGLIDKYQPQVRSYQSGGSYVWTKEGEGFQLFWRGSRSATSMKGSMYCRIGSGSHATVFSGSYNHKGANVFATRSEDLFQQNTWYNITVVVASNGSYAFYVQGEEVSSYTVTSFPGLDFGNTNDMWIGRGKNAGWDAANFETSGGTVNIGRVHIYNRPLTEAEVWQNYSAEKAIYYP